MKTIVVLCAFLAFVTQPAISLNSSTTTDATSAQPPDNVTAPGPEKSKDAALAALEKKLHGTWTGSPCRGNFNFNADGTFILEHFSPGQNTITGDWSLRWEALPPTLVLNCKTSDFRKKNSNREEFAYLAKPLEFKLLQLNGDTLAIQFPDTKDEWRYERRTALKEKLLGTWYGPDCGGDYTFHSDGTFEMKRFTPGNNTLTGEWSIRWNELPPTLVVVCKTSDIKKNDPERREYEHLNQPQELKLIELTAEDLALELPNPEQVWRYSRNAKVGGRMTQK